MSLTKLFFLLATLAATVSPSLAQCTTVSTCAELEALMLDSFNNGGAERRVCSSSTAINCPATGTGPVIPISPATTSGTVGNIKCDSSNLATERCIINFPNPSGFSGYTGIQVNTEKSLTLTGFEISGLRDNSIAVYVQQGSNFICHGCVFRDNRVDSGSSGIVRDLNTLPCERSLIGSIVFQNTMFEDNVGIMVSAPSSILVIRDSIFFENSAYSQQRGGLLNFGSTADAFDNVLTDNVFVDNDMTLARAVNRPNWLFRRGPQPCPSDARCTPLQNEVGSNCASGNLGASLSLCNGMRWLNPLSGCTVYPSCPVTPPTVTDIYPIDESIDFSQYLQTRFAEGVSCAPSDVPSNTPSLSIAPSDSPSLSELPSIAPSDSPSDVPSDSPSVSELPTCQGGNSGAGCGGDPHFRTFGGGKRYSWHGEGDIKLVGNPTFRDSIGLEIHARTTIKHSKQSYYSVIEAVAIQIGDLILEVSPDNYYINGEANAEMPIKVHGNIHISRYIQQLQHLERAVYEIDLAQDGIIKFSTFSDFVLVNIDDASEEEWANTVGMLGSFHEGTLLARDQVTVIQDYDTVGDFWQVLESEPKLFQYLRAPQHPLEKPRMPPKDLHLFRRRLRATSRNEIAEAEEACSHRIEDNEQCIFDVLATGDVDIAIGGQF